MTVVPLKGQESTASRSGQGREAPTGQSGHARQHRGETWINGGSSECRPRTVPLHVRKSRAGYPTAARHRPTDPAHRRPRARRCLATRGGGTGTGAGMGPSDLLEADPWPGDPGWRSPLSPDPLEPDARECEEELSWSSRAAILASLWAWCNLANSVESSKFAEDEPPSRRGNGVTSKSLKSGACPLNGLHNLRLYLQK